MIYLFKHKLVNNSKDYEKFFIIKEYSKNSLVFNEGEKCMFLGLVLEGTLTISTLNFHKEYIINILNQDDIFGDTLIFNSNNTYLGDGIATTKLKIAYIDKANLLKLLEDKIILENYLSLLATKTLTIKNQLKLASQKSLRDKILFYLANYAKENNTKIISIKSKELLANILNVPRPSLSRELINLKKDGIIEFDRTKIILKGE